MGIVIPTTLIVFTCLLIWRACDGFEVASEYVGRNLSEGVRGGTINAVSSSIPEMFTTLIALFALSDKDGFSVGLGTTAGSALFNGMVIPAASILAVVGTVVLGRRVLTVRVSRKVLLRDGIALIACNVLLIVLINGVRLFWWQGLILMIAYFAYLAYMLLSMKSPSPTDDCLIDDSPDASEESENRGLWRAVFYWCSGGPLLDLERFFVGEKQRQQMKEGTWNGWPLLFVSTSIIALSCWLLVRGCEWLGTGAGNQDHPCYFFCGYQLEGIGMPTMFVAVIFASMATSVPDTVISIRDAMDGDYDDAVANALGSNIFDICFALGFPLFLYTICYGPIEMDATIAQQSSELRLLLLLFTIAGFFVYYFGNRGIDENGNRYVEMGRIKAILLLLMYAAFVGYVVGRSMNLNWAKSISNGLESLLTWLPTFGG